jgi:5-methylcytosine-specific restriction endonuclease McrA
MLAELACECSYCGRLPGVLDDGLNGLDRIDCSLGYTIENCVSCCGTCNAMRGAYDVDIFISHVRIIASKSAGAAAANGERAKNSAPVNNDTASGRAPYERQFFRHAKVPKTKNVKNLTQDQQISLRSGRCYLCARSPALGIDRVDSTGDYTVANSRSCCSSCNYLKKDMKLEDFLEHVAHVARFTSDVPLPADLDDKPLQLINGHTQVSARWRGPCGLELIFPSRGIAHDAGATSKKMRFEEATPREYRQQNVAPAEAERIIRRMLLVSAGLDY